MNDVTWSLSLEVKGGPAFKLPPEVMKVDAYDKIDVDLSERGQNTVRIQPSKDASEIMFFMVIQNDYKVETPPDPTKRISYVIEPDAAAKDNGAQASMSGDDASVTEEEKNARSLAQKQQPAKGAGPTDKTPAPRVVLERCHLVIGSGAMQLFANLPTIITFFNERDRPASITVLVGRKVPAERRIDMRAFNPAGASAS